MTSLSLPQRERVRCTTDDGSEPVPKEQGAPEPGRRRPVPNRAAVALALGSILAVFAARCFVVARADSITSDESTHLVHTFHFWMTGDDLAMWKLGTPRLPHLLNALPSYLAMKQVGRLPTAEAPDRPAALNELVLAGSVRLLVAARMVAVGWGLALLLVTFWAVARSRGVLLGLAAAGLLSLVPEVLAHSAIAGSDIPFAASAFLALVVLARYAERPTTGRWLAAAAAVGLAWAMRHSAVLLVIVAVGVHLACALKRPGEAPLAERLLASVFAGLALTAVAFAVLWAGDGFATTTLGEVAEDVTRFQIPRKFGSLDLSNVPIPTSAVSLVKQVSHQGQGHQAYFCGEFSQHGWPRYFPVAFLLKTPVGFLALMVLALARFRPRDALEWICAACLALLWVTLVRNKVNIGVRYALLTYPLIMPLVVRLFEPAALRDRVWGPLTVLATGWLICASVACHPRYLSSFNELGGGPSRGWLYLADSNIDWGQDLDALAATVRRLGITEVTTDISTERRLQVPGVFAIPNPSREFQVPAMTPPNRRLYGDDGGFIPVYTRYVAVSVSRLMGLYSQNDMSWLRTRRLVARVNDSIFVFDLDRPADKPFFE